MTSNGLDLSIVIPALNEAGKIGRDMTAAAVFLRGYGLRGEIIIVDDGSTDGTAEIARTAGLPPGVGRQVIRLEENSGKGVAVKTGILASGGEVVLYADSGTCIPYANAETVIRRIRRGDLDMGFASRRLKGTVICRNRPFRRRVISRLFHLAAVAVAGLPRWISDSQCGFKVYRGDAARALFSGLQIRGFLFELEFILKALKSGFRIEEFPVEWSCDLDTRLHAGSDARNILRELFQVRKILKDFAKEDGRF